MGQQGPAHPHAHPLTAPPWGEAPPTPRGRARCGLAPHHLRAPYAYFLGELWRNAAAPNAGPRCPPRLLRAGLRRSARQRAGGQLSMRYVAPRCSSRGRSGPSRTPGCGSPRRAVGTRLRSRRRPRSGRPKWGGSASSCAPSSMAPRRTRPRPRPNHNPEPSRPQGAWLKPRREELTMAAMMTGRRAPGRVRRFGRAGEADRRGDSRVTDGEVVCRRVDNFAGVDEGEGAGSGVDVRQVCSELNVRERRGLGYFSSRGTGVANPGPPRGRHPSRQQPVDT